jgi:hypothetical protein
MNCIIDSAILFLVRQGQKPKAIRRYIRMKYRVNIDLKSLKERVKRLSTSPILSES